MGLVSLIDHLKRIKVEKPGGILTIYLDTDRSKPEQQRGQWKIQLKNSLKEVEEKLISKGNAQELQNFRILAEKAEREILSRERKLQKGLILFASHDLTLWELNLVQVPLEFELFWKEWPQLSQLVVLSAHYPACGIIHMQKDKVKVIDMELGQVLEEFRYTASSNPENWRHDQGSSSPMGDYDDRKRRDPHANRWLRSLSGELKKEARKRDWQGVYLMGETEWSPSFRQAFQDLSFMRVLPKHMNGDSPSDIFDWAR